MVLVHSEIFFKASDAAALHGLHRLDESATAVACSPVPMVVPLDLFHLMTPQMDEA